MADVLAENLSGKAVMGTDGAELGMLYNITMDLKSGSLSDLLVDPHEEVSTRDLSFEQDSAGRLRVPVSRVQAVKDYIVIKR
jgi:sporulation protein YlmC with PRC-barrel domain